MRVAYQPVEKQRDRFLAAKEEQFVMGSNTNVEA
jgi:hypothetical protein